MVVEAKDFSQIADLVMYRDVTNFPQIAAECDSRRGTVPRDGTWQGRGQAETYEAVSALKSVPPVAANIRAARPARATSPKKKLAAAVGVTRRTRVNDWENGRHQPSRQHLTELCAALGHTRGWFHDHHPQKKKRTSHDRHLGARRRHPHPRHAAACSSPPGGTSDATGPTPSTKNKAAQNG